MRREAVICDVCGRVKQAANHWFLAAIYHGEIRILPSHAMWGEADDVCGEDCLHKWISAHLSDISKEAHAEEQPTENV